MIQSEPIIIAGKPSRLPLRGPLQTPTEVNTNAHVKEILKENELMLEVIRSFVNEPNVNAHVVPLIERVHRNITYLAILKETSTYSMSDFIPMYNTEPDAALIHQIAAVMYPEVPAAGEPTGNVDSVLHHLTLAMEDAKHEANRERSLQMILELENEVMRHKQKLLHGTARAPYIVDNSSRITTGHPVFDYSRSTTGDSTISSMIDQSMNLSECLSLFSTMPPHMQDSLYMSYFESGLSDVEPGSVLSVYQPSDFESLCFIMFRSTVRFIPSKIVKFTVDDLSTIIAASSIESHEETLPRMNLLDALNVGPNDDISHIVTVRKCHKLGFKSNIFLKQYFSKFGKVDRVVLLPMRTKQLNKGNRPSSMGFVVFENSDIVSRVLDTPTHMIKGWPIEVRNFVKPADKPGDEFAW